MIKEHNIKVGVKEVEYEGGWIRLPQARPEVARSSGTRRHTALSCVILVSPGISASWKLRHRVSPKYRDRTKHRAGSTPHLTSSQTERGPAPLPHLSIDPCVTGC
jgi:hypothetical protein